ncbi:hypothetical protein E3N88_32418 [Mikania micrantha]|uniref:Uncharacterized protein n=1 Tax=Mikania micrantha TaxID=192012 RepID=A0A5N6M8D5_9ASTR|nr:hypothetical protein E3N88_32418 [Mikania micrantha]
MMNVGENRVRNGVLDCPKSKNEEKFLSVDRMAHRDSSGNSRGTRSPFWLLVAMKNQDFDAFKQSFEAIRSHESSQGTCFHTLIVVLAAEIRQIRDFDCTAMADPAEQYIYQRFPYLRLDDTPSSSAGSDSDPSEASSAASQATPAGPHTIIPQTCYTTTTTSPILPPAAPILPSPPHSPWVPTSAERRQGSSPRRVPAWDGLRRMRGKARKTTGLPPRHHMAPRDEPQTIHEVGESSHQAEWRAQLQQVTQDLQGMRQDIQQQSAMIDDTRSTVLEILTSHLTIIDRVNTLEVDTQAWRTSVEERLRRTWVRRIIATFWQQVELLKA